MVGWHVGERASGYEAHGAKVRVVLRGAVGGGCGHGCEVWLTSRLSAGAIGAVGPAGTLEGGGTVERGVHRVQVAASKVVENFIIGGEWEVAGQWPLVDRGVWVAAPRSMAAVVVVGAKLDVAGLAVEVFGAPAAGDR